ncbi:Flp family type IVb pilin [Halalkalibacter alkaliphilus]|uniref:Flp family type IVb pilin n=1 Tax=Halalkalibacter alkaliphilus TaxID=2917993 RepID=A0A9X1ZXW9_9BACI|nr:Flp family type IVb pilin [Halalkalibacter alkaliphilus]MCL7746733.1 Flp family type IVb pilin [Halalkalibacter alkaliphilus]
MMSKVMKFFKEEDGQGMTEYGLILGLIALAAVAAMFTMGDTIKQQLGEITTRISSGFNGNQ